MALYRALGKPSTGALDRPRNLADLPHFLAELFRIGEITEGEKVDDDSCTKISKAEGPRKF